MVNHEHVQGSKGSHLFLELTYASVQRCCMHPKEVGLCNVCVQVSFRDRSSTQLGTWHLSITAFFISVSLQICRRCLLLTLWTVDTSVHAVVVLMCWQQCKSSLFLAIWTRCRSVGTYCRFVDSLVTESNARPTIQRQTAAIRQIQYIATTAIIWNGCPFLSTHRAFVSLGLPLKPAGCTKDVPTGVAHSIPRDEHAYRTR